MWPFKKKTVKEPGSFIRERWNTDFRGKGESRFVTRSSEDYSAEVTENQLLLTLNRENLFAWIDNPAFRYTDFILDAELEIKPENKHSAAGFLFRHIDDDNYYYFLVSNNGFFRLDVVFNGNPQPLINWTEIPFKITDLFSFRCIANGVNFSFYINDEWVGEIDDDRIDAGDIAFAGQNYNEQETARFSLHLFMIESRPLEVEAGYYKWKNIVKADPSNRITLAKMFFNQKQYSAAVVQIKRALKTKVPVFDDYFLMAVSLRNLRLYSAALENIELCLEIDSNSDKGLFEKANLLYMMNSFLQLRDFLKKIYVRFEENPVYQNLYGNAEYSLGNWSIAAEYYDNALRLDSGMPLYALNAARSFEHIGEEEKALNYFLTASRIFFRQEAYNDIIQLLPVVSRLDKDNKEVKALYGKVYFHEGKIKEAGVVFADLINDGYKESSVYFMYGLVLSLSGKKDEALEYLNKAAAIEPDYPLYWFKLAEAIYLAGKNPGKELERALSLSPDDPWVLNLAGLYNMNIKDFKKAEEYLEKACKIASDEKAIMLNYAEVLFNNGNKEEAYKVNRKIGDNPGAFNQIGNFSFLNGKYEEAMNSYEKALSLEPSDPLYMENCAAAAIHLDRISRAEELLVKVLNISPSSQALNLIGNLSVIKREYSRAEASYTEGLVLDPHNIEILENYTEMCLDRLDYKKGKKLITKVLQLTGEEMPERAVKLLNRIRSEFETRYACSTCGKEWWVPNNIGIQPGLRVYGEPHGDSPAGKCGNCGKIYCVECASEHLRDKRFICPSCDENLKLTDDYLKYLVSSYIKPDGK